MGELVAAGIAACALVIGFLIGVGVMEMTHRSDLEKHANNGKVFKAGPNEHYTVKRVKEEPPDIPFHPNCRCQIVDEQPTEFTGDMHHT